MAVSFTSVVALGACSSTGGLGNILGGVLGGNGQANQINGYVQGVNPRYQQIGIQMSDGQTVVVNYDNNTQVVYQNRNYSPTSLENGDQVTVRIQDNGNGSYYTNYVQVDRSVRDGGNTGVQNGNVQAFQGAVGQIDRRNGLFTVNERSFGVLTVSLSNNATRSDVDRFNTLRPGDFVRFYGYRVGNSQVELRQFY